MAMISPSIEGGAASSRYERSSVWSLSFDAEYHFPASSAFLTSAEDGKVSKIKTTIAISAFFIPKSYGTSISITGGPSAALWAFLIFYISCAAVTWWFYTRPTGLLHNIEHGILPASKDAQPAQ